MESLLCARCYFFLDNLTWWVLVGAPTSSLLLLLLLLYSGEALRNWISINFCKEIIKFVSSFPSNFSTGDLSSPINQFKKVLSNLSGSKSSLYHFLKCLVPPKLDIPSNLERSDIYIIQSFQVKRRIGRDGM